MADMDIHGKAAPLPGGVARAPHAGGGEAALDLSLGHIGTTSPQVDEIDFVTYGPYRVTLDYGSMTAEVEIDEQFYCSRAERREASRKVTKLLKTATKSGMRLVGTGGFL